MTFQMMQGLIKTEKICSIDQIKRILEKKYYPKNIFMYGDSNTGKTYIKERLLENFSRYGKICCKVKDPKYINEYDNQVCIISEKFGWKSFEFEDILSICERDEILMPRKNKSPINIVSKFNIFTSNFSFDQIYTFEDTYYDKRGIKKKSPLQRKALY